VVERTSKHQLSRIRGTGELTLLQLTHLRLEAHPNEGERAADRQVPQERVVEWLAARGYRHWQKDWEYYLLYSERTALSTKFFIKPFYWDLWLDLENLRGQTKRWVELAVIVQLAWRVHCTHKDLLKETEEEKGVKVKIEEEHYGVF
jgi:hypothetical protein